MSKQDNDKVAARSTVQERLAGVSSEEFRGWSSAICRRLIEWGPTRNAVCPMVYLPTAVEAGVDCYTAWRLKNGLTVCGPRVDWESLDMSARVIGDLERGIEIRRHGIREPVDDALAVDSGRIDVVLTPGVVFDESGRRVGRGAGCYDRFLAQSGLMAGILTVGVCFEAQLVARAPADKHDVPMRAIITERRIIEPMKQ